ncbi:hypothetical protein AVEN_262165-1 [Araneus ventricosus]|uniref:Uncharacterized protein n=1 Tax=Araneus ventricosus TaxID=182803 RepID=A0A4Y2EJU9_ARAVE|nr:hypothetical protein AVEN_262165-1 [Araneus ventricosus]
MSFIIAAPVSARRRFSWKFCLSFKLYFSLSSGTSTSMCFILRGYPGWSACKAIPCKRSRRVRFPRTSSALHPAPSADEDGLWLLPKMFKEPCNAIPGPEYDVSYQVVDDFRS